MYIPPAFRVDDKEVIHDFMEQHRFAMIVSTGDDGPIASHLPFLLDRNTGHFGRLIGHMAKANSHWRHADEQTVLVVFSGPHAYISPSWYDDTNVVPTWNYTAVHATGQLKIEENSDRLRQIVERFVSESESSMPSPWTMDNVDEDFVHGLTQAIVGFTIDIGHLEGKWKLSQNHTESRQQGVIDGLRNRNRGDDSRVANLMNQNKKPR